MEVLPISVITITRNNERTIEDCLISIQRNNPAEIIVVDGNSSDRTVEIARKYTERIYSDGGRRMCYASQLGTEQATQEYVAYVDADVVLTEVALATMLAELQGSDSIVISAKQLLGIKHPSYWEWASYQHGQLSVSRRTQGYLGTLACLFRRETMLKIGFDTSEKYLHDLDLELRLRREGHKLGVSSAIVYHHHRENLRSFAKYRFLLGKVAARYIRKWGPWHVRFWPPLYTLYWLGFCLIKGKPKLIPYFVVNGTVLTAGMVKGFFELIGEIITRRQKSAG
jgi:glycosyltransferase involved in cell wall biosynthesis